MPEMRAGFRRIILPGHSRRCWPDSLFMLAEMRIPE